MDGLIPMYIQATLTGLNGLFQKRNEVGRDMGETGGGIKVELRIFIHMKF